MGLKNSGKDTVAAYLVKEKNYERRAFADPLKKSVAALFDIPFSEIERMKNNLHESVWLINGAEPHKNLTFREFLQRYGTEAHRDVPEMGENFWVDLTLPVSGYYIGRDIVVSDVRFENEARRIRYLRGTIIEVSRSGLVNQDPHRSEQELFEIEPDYTIFNNGTIADLGASVEIMLTNMVSQIGA
jgi:hypothetical protein